MVEKDMKEAREPKEEPVDDATSVGGVSNGGVRIRLEEQGLWKKFNTLTNEMIVTKNGR
jgi:hypothetical protein